MRAQRRTAKNKPKSTASFKRVSTVAVKKCGTSARAVLAVKLMCVLLSLREVNNHLQGLYAEVGKIVYEHQMASPSASKLPPPHVKELFHKIIPLRKKMEKLERESRTMKKTA